MKTSNVLWGCVAMLAAFPVVRASADSFAVLSYNVRGLPAVVIEDRTAEIAAIAPLLEDYHTSGGLYDGIASVVLLQELFDQGYYDTLTSSMTVSYPFKTAKDTSGPTGIGDGLNRLTDDSFFDYDRTQWDMCFGTFGANGSDCDTNKGYAYARHVLPGGAEIHIYNLHADAGQDEGSRAARRDNIAQLITNINTRTPAGAAVIVAGDTNSLYTRSGNDVIETLPAMTGVTDVWVELVNGGVTPSAGPDNESGCDTDPAGSACELVDKIFYRSGSDVMLTPTSYEVLADLFSDGGGNDLSDHFPVSAMFDYTIITSSTTSSTVPPSTIPTTTIVAPTTTIVTTTTSSTTTTVPTTSTSLFPPTTIVVSTSTTTSTTTTVPTTSTSLFPPTTVVASTSTTTVPGASTTTTSTTLPTFACADPVALTTGSIGDGPVGRIITATDALFLLRAAVGSQVCELCVCDADGSGTIAATDALIALKAAVGQPVTLQCPACT